MSELYAVGKNQSSNDKENRLYEIMLRLGIIKEGDVKESISSACKRLEFPKGFYKAMVFQLSCLLSDDEINDYCNLSNNYYATKDSKIISIFFNNLGLKLSEKYRIPGMINYGDRFCKLFRSCLNSYNDNTINNYFIPDFVELQHAFYILLKKREIDFPADKDIIENIPLADETPKYYLGNIFANSIFEKNLIINKKDLMLN